MTLGEDKTSYNLDTRCTVAEWSRNDARGYHVILPFLGTDDFFKYFQRDREDKAFKVGFKVGTTAVKPFVETFVYGPASQRRN